MSDDDTVWRVTNKGLEALEKYKHKDCDESTDDADTFYDWLEPTDPMMKIPVKTETYQVQERRDVNFQLETMDMASKKAMDDVLELWVEREWRRCSSDTREHRVRYREADDPNVDMCKLGHKYLVHNNCPYLGRNAVLYQDELFKECCYNKLKDET
jgi:hypothetical protein